MDPELWLQAMQGYMAPVSTPEGFTSREIVRCAIEFDDPPRIPYSFMDPLASDFVELGVIASPGGGSDSPRAAKGEMVVDNWGVGHRSTGRLCGHAEEYPLADLDNLATYEFPAIIDPERMKACELVAAKAHEVGKYVVACDLVGTIERLRGLLGFENMLEAMYLDRERFDILVDKLTDMTIEVVQAYARMGNVDGFMTYQDWGLQSQLQIRPEHWRDIFKPSYARIAKACHDFGMHYIWHCCGYILDIVPDMIAIGVDVLQLDQPRLMTYEALTEKFGGKICFWNMVDIQWSARKEVTPDEIKTDVKDMVAQFNRFGGGFMARQYPAWTDIELTSEKNHAMVEAFMEHGCA
jgi:hypothetical protein